MSCPERYCQLACVLVQDVFAVTCELRARPRAVRGTFDRWRERTRSRRGRLMCREPLSPHHSFSGRAPDVLERASGSRSCAADAPRVPAAAETSADGADGAAEDSEARIAEARAFANAPRSGSACVVCGRLADSS